jgi:hypothetical protein
VKRPTTGRLRTASLVLRLTLLAAIAAAVAPACGKKGPPLPPLVKMPAPPDPFVARRLGAVAYLQVRIPSANTDKTTPADIERVEIYGLTGTPAGNEDIFKSGTLVASIRVRKPPEEAGESKQARQGRHQYVPPAERPAPPPRPPASMETGFDQGDTVVVTEQLGPEQFRPVTLKTKVTLKRKPESAQAIAGTTVLRPIDAPSLAPLPARVYVAVGINHKGQKGTASAERSILLLGPASAPSAPTITYTENAFSVTWTPPADAEPTEASGNVLPSMPIGSRQVFGGFNVYEVPAPPSGTEPARIPAPINEKPLPGPPLVDKRMTFGTPRCYGVRAVTLFGAQQIEGEASPATCVTPVDTFPPAAPTSLRAVGSEGAVSLIWDANKESDLAGYLVLRAGVPDGEFAPLTPEPIKTTTFNDTTVKPGLRYAYVVVAVDTSKNRSAPSNRVEESGR